jgi:hypothetical protein
MDEPIMTDPPLPTLRDMFIAWRRLAQESKATQPSNALVAMPERMYWDQVSLYPLRRTDNSFVDDRPDDEVK